ncbi:MAG: N-acetyltransferase [Dehalococcoidia bacterium]|nr:MAG: N-acetyltransferase [Dehalococcoidia bacterium]UCG83785.1 MAG: N-acetyltransferase [Dehalococcoidia bacterium]
MVVVRKESPQDYEVVRRVNELAFGQPNEADLVDALRGVAQPRLFLVAVTAGQVVGHIFFSPVVIESGDSDFTAVALAPMSVLPEYQRRGIGSELVNEGLIKRRQLGITVVVVIGHPDYYPRFGFTPAKERGLQCEYEVPDEAFMVLELTPGSLPGKGGFVKFPPEFTNV